MKNSTTEEKLICGKTEKEIRESYFKCKLGELLADIQILGFTEAEFGDLSVFLEGLRAKEALTVNQILKITGGRVLGQSETEKINPDLFYTEDDLSDDRKKKIANSVNTIKSAIRNVGNKARNKVNFKNHEYLDVAHEITAAMIDLSELIIRLKQKYKKKLTEIFNENDISRKAAEEFAELTSEYRNYKTYYELYEIAKDFIINCRRENNQFN